MATRKIVTASPTRNVGSSVVGAGTQQAGSYVTNSQNLTFWGQAPGTVNAVTGPLTNLEIAQGVVGHTYKPVAAGTFAGQNNSNFLVYGHGRTNTIAGVPNLALAFTGADDPSRRSMNKFYKDRRTTITSFGWVINANGTTTYTIVRQNSVTTFAEDNAANPTRLIPGEFVTMVAGQAPTYNDYAARTMG